MRLITSQLGEGQLVTVVLFRLVEKFRVHSQEERAEALDSLTTSFLSSRLHGSYEQAINFFIFMFLAIVSVSLSLSSQSEIHYGVLQLLLSLSQQPTAAPWKPSQEEDPVRQGTIITTGKGASSSCTCVYV